MGNAQQRSEIKVMMSAVNQIVSRVYMSNSSALSTSVNMNQKITFKLGKTGVMNCGEGGWIINQSAVVKMRIVNKVSSNMVTSIKNDLKNELESKTEAILEMVRDIGGGILANDSQDITQSIKQQVENVVENTVTHENLTNTIGNAVSVQNQDIEINGTVNAAQCVFTQSSLIDMQTNATTQLITSSIFSNKVLNNFFAEANSAAKLEQKGLTSILEALAAFGPLMLLGLAAVLLGSSFVVKSIPPYVWAVLGVVVVAFFIWKLFIKRTESWDCQRIDGMTTGKCRKFNDPSTGQFASEAECVEAKECPQYWKCVDNKECKRAMNVFDGETSSSLNECKRTCPKIVFNDDDVSTDVKFVYYSNARPPMIG